MLHEKPTGHWVILLVASSLLITIAFHQPASAADKPEYRTWTDASGKFEVRAAFVELRAGEVVLKAPNGNQQAFPLNALSPKDQDYVKSLVPGVAEPGNQTAEPAAAVAVEANVSAESTEQAPAAVDSYVGMWLNANRKTNSVTRVQIRRDGENIAVHMWGKCHPRDCDWGEVPGITNIDALSLTWNQGFVVRTQQLKLLPGEKLQLTDHSHYIDNSGRRDRDSQETFVKVANQKLPGTVAAKASQPLRQVAKEGAAPNQVAPPATTEKPGSAVAAPEPVAEGVAKPEQAAKPEQRTWTDASGGFTVQAEFVEAAAGKVTLKQADGSLVAIPLDGLSPKDQDYVKSLVPGVAEPGKQAAQPADAPKPGDGADAPKPGDAPANAEKGAADVPPAVAAAPVAKPGPRTRFEMLGDLYVKLDDNGKQVQALQARLAGVLGLILPILQQYAAFETQIQNEWSSSSQARSSVAAVQRATAGYPGVSVAAQGPAPTLVAQSDQRIATLRVLQTSLLQTNQSIFLDKASIEKKLAGTVEQGSLLGEQLVWLCDPLDRIPLQKEHSAITALTAAIADQQGRSPLPYFYLARGFENLRAKKYVEMEADFRVAVNLASALYQAPALRARLSSFGAIAQAVALDRSGQVAQAKQLFSIAAAASSNPGMANLFYANVRMERGDYQRALFELKHALKVAPGQPYVHEAMARALVASSKLRNNKEALEHARQACELDKSQTWTFLDTLAFVQASSGDFTSAVESARKSIDLAPVEAAPMLQQRIDCYERRALPGSLAAAGKKG